MSIDLLTIIPTRGTVRIEWALMFKQIAVPTNMTSATKIVPGLDVVEARNVAAKTLIDEGAEYLFFLDDDTFVGPQVLRRLHNQMQQNPDWDLLSGIVPMKTPDCEPCVYREDEPGAYWGWTFGETFPIDACGMACALIRRSAFEKVSEPWFGWLTEHTTDAYTEMGEDVGFCRKLKEAGGVLMADGAVIGGHMNDKGKMWQLPIDAAPFRRADEATMDQIVVASA